jgi:hypothetical protein
MRFAGAPRVAHRVGRYVASADRRRGQLCTVMNPQCPTYRSGKVVQTNRATSDIELGTVLGNSFLGWLCVIGAVGGNRVNSNLHLFKQWAHLR